MRTHHRYRLVLIVFAALAFGSHVHAESKRKSSAVSRADLDRLETQIDDYQRVIERLFKLNQQSIQSAGTLLDDSRPTPKPDVKRKPKIEIKPAGGTVVGKVAGASDAVVYIETITASTKGTATMKQEGKQFVPRVLVVQKGTTVTFPNADAIFHNVFSVTPLASFDLGSYRQGESRSVTMTRPGLVTVYCNMHPQMVGHVLVVPSSNYVRAGKDGYFRLTNVPAGRHRVVAWAPNSKTVVAQAEVVDNEVVTVELQLKKGQNGSHMNKDGMPYGSYEK